MSDIPVVNWSDGKEAGKATLDSEVFGGPIQKALLHEVSWAYGQNRRRFSASTKTRKDVSGGGKKPWKQKGTGRARSSSIRAPHWRGGGTVFGPHPKDIHYRIPRNMRLAALRASIMLKVKEGHVIVLDQIKLGAAKTREVQKGLDRLKIQSRTLLIIAKHDEGIERAGRNIKGLSIRLAQNVTGADIAGHVQCVVEKDALNAVTNRLEKTKEKS
jgi:large subunit ribosomal protein L4